MALQKNHESQRSILRNTVHPQIRGHGLLVISKDTMCLLLKAQGIKCCAVGKIILKVHMFSILWLEKNYIGSRPKKKSNFSGSAHYLSIYHLCDNFIKNISLNLIMTSWPEKHSQKTGPNTLKVSIVKQKTKIKKLKHSFTLKEIRRLRQEDCCGFKVSQGCVMRPWRQGERRKREGGELLVKLLGNLIQTIFEWPSFYKY